MYNNYKKQIDIQSIIHNPTTIMTEDIDTQFNDLQKRLMIGRRIQLSMGCIILLGIIINIFLRKLYIYNTTRLFMYSCVCCFFGMFVVLLHIPQYFTAGTLYAYDDTNQKLKDNYILKIFDKMREGGGADMILCGLEAFINLLMYNLSYLFAILISYNVFCVITDNYRGFMKNLIRKPKLWIILIAMFITYLLPYIFMFIPSNFNEEQYFYSYGPTGFTQQIGSDKAVLLFFCGPCFNPDSGAYKAISIFHIHVLFPLIMLIIHSIIIYQNYKRTKNISKDYLNSKQKFLLNSGKISIVLFVIQLLNAGKLILSVTFAADWYTFILILNYIFDTYPVFLLIFYLRYTKQQRGLQHGSSTLIQQ